MNARLSRLVLSGVAVFALAFGFLTIYSGGQVIFGPPAAREAAGDYLPFVVWFNFVAGFAYVAAAVGLLTARAWAPRLALIIAVATALVFAAFGALALTGTPFEMRTVAAMALRTVVWAGIAWLSGMRSRRIFSECCK